MAVSSRGRSEFAKRWKEQEASAEGTKVWAETKLKAAGKKVPVVYYIARDGHLEQPHFMEVPLSSPEGLYLRDVIDRLNVLRGKGMAAMYSWSSKRSYRNGFVWHDLSEDDFIDPVHGQEYILKGSELLHLGKPSSSQEALPTSSSTFEKPPEIPNSARDDSNLPVSRRKKTSWGSLDLNEPTVYMSEPTPDHAVKFSDASTQTDDPRQRRRAPVREDGRVEIPNPEATVLGTDDISPPPSTSSPETVEALIKADGRIVAIPPEYRDRTVGPCPNGRARASASAVLMHLFSCGSVSVKEPGISLASQYRGRLPRAKKTQRRTREMEAASGRIMPSSFGAIRLEDKEYFSGSVIETRRKPGADGAGEFPVLKRSSSCNAVRSLRMELSKEIDEDDLDGCLPRKPRTRKAGSLSIPRSTQRSIRING